MNDPLRTHILFLEDKLQTLTDSLTRAIPSSERKQVEARIELAVRALDCYRQGFEIESVLRYSDDLKVPT